MYSPRFPARCCAVLGLLLLNSLFLGSGPAARSDETGPGGQRNGQLSAVAESEPARESGQDASWQREVPEAERPAHTERDKTTWVPPANLDPVSVIDLLIEKGWRDREVTPADRCTDMEYVRRVYVDLAGRIPSRAETEAFLQRTDSRKRQTLVDELLASDEFAQHAAEIIDAVLLGRPGRDRTYQRRLDSPWFDYLRRAFRNNRSWDQITRDILLARPASPEQEGAQWFLYERGDKYQEIAEAIGPGFFGVQIQCAQCHDHPLAGEIEQRHYWGLVAFFNRSHPTDSPSGPRVAERAAGGFSKFTDLAGFASDAELTFLGKEHIVPEPRPESDEAAEAAKQLDEAHDQTLYVLTNDAGEKLQPPVPKFSRRQQFVDAVVQDNPLIARAFVNRMWGWLMGRGIVHPVDRMDSNTPASHPELLHWLAIDFEQHDYDIQRLIRAITASRAYQLTSVRTSAVVGDEGFAWSITRPMNAESYYRSVLQLVDDSQEAASVEAVMAFQRQFPEVFPEVSMTELSQALFLSNNDVMQMAVDRGATRRWNDIAACEQTSAEWQSEFVRDLFDAAYGRAPQADELELCVAYLQERDDRPEQAMAQLLWGVATSSEFRFNH